MCYLVRQHHAGAVENGDAPLPPSLDRLRPRWIGAAAAALVAGVAVAALVAPASTSPVLNTKDAAAPAVPLASKLETVPTAAVSQTTAKTSSPLDQSSTPLDDGVPSPAEMAKAGMGHCEHGL
jgi:hypothetical protein